MPDCNGLFHISELDVCAATTFVIQGPPKINTSMLT